jgi:hypothetical protein
LPISLFTVNCTLFFLKIVAVALFLTVVEAYVYHPSYPHHSVVHSERNGANFAYSINSAPYIHHPSLNSFYTAKQVAAAIPSVLSHGYAFSHPVYPHHYPVGVYPFAETAVKPTVQADKPTQVTANDAVIVESL